MGHTHYWNVTRKPTRKEWATLMDQTHALFKTARARGIKLAGWDGEGKPRVAEDTISFNGRGDESFESFTLAPEPGSDFCKTGLREYDPVVVAMLILAEAQGFLTWTSDGNDEENAFGHTLARHVMDKVLV